MAQSKLEPYLMGVRQKLFGRTRPRTEPSAPVLQFTPAAAHISMTPAGVTRTQAPEEKPPRHGFTPHDLSEYVRIQVEKEQAVAAPDASDHQSSAADAEVKRSLHGPTFNSTRYKMIEEERQQRIDRQRREHPILVAGDDIQKAFDELIKESAKKDDRESRRRQHEEEIVMRARVRIAKANNPLERTRKKRKEAYLMIDSRTGRAIESHDAYITTSLNLLEKTVATIKPLLGKVRSLTGLAASYFRADAQKTLTDVKQVIAYVQKDAAQTARDMHVSAEKVTKYTTQLTTRTQSLVEKSYGTLESLEDKTMLALTADVKDLAPVQHIANVQQAIASSLNAGIGKLLAKVPKKTITQPVTRDELPLAAVDAVVARYAQTTQAIEVPQPHTKATATVIATQSYNPIHAIVDISETLSERDARFAAARLERANTRQYLRRAAELKITFASYNPEHAVEQAAQRTMNDAQSEIYAQREKDLTAAFASERVFTRSGRVVPKYRKLSDRITVALDAFYATNSTRKESISAMAQAAGVTERTAAKYLRNHEIVATVQHALRESPKRSILGYDRNTHGESLLERVGYVTGFTKGVAKNHLLYIKGPVAL